MVPIVREESGLARSSRNRYLSEAEKEAALILSKSLKEGQKAFEGGEKDARKLEEIVTEKIKTEPMSVIDYVKVYSWPYLEPVDTVEGEALMAIAVRIGTTRLIDNIILK